MRVQIETTSQMLYIVTINKKPLRVGQTDLSLLQDCDSKYPFTFNICCTSCVVKCVHFTQPCFISIRTHTTLSNKIYEFEKIVQNPFVSWSHLTFKLPREHIFQEECFEERFERCEQFQWRNNYY